jgi:hypothetical protein
VPNGSVTGQMRIEKNKEENHCDQTHKSVCSDEHKKAYYSTTSVRLNGMHTYTCIFTPDNLQVQAKSRSVLNDIYHLPYH